MEGRPPPETAPHHPHGTQPPTRHAGRGDSAGPPHPHTRAHSTRVADPDSLPRGRTAGGGRAPELRSPSQWRKAFPPGTHFRHSHSAQRRLARAHAAGPVMGFHAHTNRSRDTRVAEPRLPAPKDGLPGEGQRLIPDTPHNGGRPTPPGDRPPPPPRHAAPHKACRPRGQCWPPTPTQPRPQHAGSGPRQAAQRTDSRGREGA